MARQQVAVILLLAKVVCGGVVGGIARQETELQCGDTLAIDFSSGSPEVQCDSPCFRSVHAWAAGPVFKRMSELEQYGLMVRQEYDEDGKVSCSLVDDISDTSAIQSSLLAEACSSVTPFTTTTTVGTGVTEVTSTNTGTGGPSGVTGSTTTSTGVTETTTTGTGGPSGDFVSETSHQGELMPASLHAHTQRFSHQFHISLHHYYLSDWNPSPHLTVNWECSVSTGADIMKHAGISTQAITEQFKSQLFERQAIQCGGFLKKASLTHRGKFQ
ncbi:hypothetical protein E2C01_006598 [Portunus trituberculatus]|uniref:Uncharacterized protein n=1 Tax=Portunus trituberculatus TaxID=210409 RepID=A0A5B7CWS6_PORTR|nr:hypothetical protein [Portunus trituberculatus]